jgi:hypothetical protein
MIGRSGTQGMPRIGLSVAWLLACLSLASAGEPAAGIPHVIGHYSDDDLAHYGALTLPRTLLYDAKHRLIPADQWPRELAHVRQYMGDAFCCVSQDQPPPTAPPADCVKILYGEQIASNFTGLLDATGKPISLGQFAPRKYLLVEYAATWCAPCRLEGQAIERFFESSPNAPDFIWVTIDMTRIAEVQSNKH